MKIHLLSLATLEETPARALEFLRGVGSTPEILKLLAQAGYTREAHDEGLRLLGNAASFVAQRSAFRTPISTVHAEALDKIGTWHRKVLRRLRVAIMRLHPEEAGDLFTNLQIAPGVDVVLAAEMFLDRLKTLRSPKGKSHAHPILTTLATRGFGADAIRDLAHAVAIARTPRTEDPDEREADVRAQRETRLAMLRELRAWYEDWAETARSVLEGRAHLIRLGLAHRRVRPVAASPTRDPEGPPPSSVTH